MKCLQEKGDGGYNLDGEGNSPLGIAIDEPTAVTNPIGDEETPSFHVSQVS